MLVLATVLAGSDALAADPIVPPEYPELQKHLIEGNPRFQDAVFEKLLKQPRDTHPDHYAGVIGEIFTRPEKTSELEPDARRKLFARLIEHLVEEQPGEDGVVLLVSSFVPHLAADAKLSEQLRTGDHFSVDLVSKRSADWDRMIDAVIRVLGDANPAIRKAAMKVLAESAVPPEERVRVPRVVAELFVAKQGIESWLPSDDEAYVAAMELLVRHRFSDGAAADALLQPFGDRFKKVKDWRLQESDAVGRELFDAVLGLKSTQRARGVDEHQQAAIELGRALIDRAATPADLVRFFPEEGERIVELQRAALKKAGSMKPAGEPGPEDPPGAWPAWAAFHVAALDNSDDADVLSDIAALINETFSRPNPKTDYQSVAAAVARRLSSGAKTDAIDERVVLAKILGRIGTIGDVRAALPAPATLRNGSDEKDAAVYGALIGAIGRVKNTIIEALVQYLSAPGEDQMPEWLRLAVAKALGYPGFTPPSKEAPRAALVLKHILTGEAVDYTPDGGEPWGLPAATRESAPTVREAAIGSLERYPGPDTAATLANIARQEGTEDGTEAGWALRALGRQLRNNDSVDAAAALAGLIGDSPSEERLIVILDRVGEGVSDDLPATALDPLREAVRSLFDKEDASDAVRLKAAEVAAKLRDAGAISKLIGLWRPDLEAGKPVAAWRKPFEALLLAVAATPKASPALDNSIINALQPASVYHHADVLALYKAMGQNANRYALKRARADIHATYATALETKDITAARREIDEALRLWDELIPLAGDVDRRDIYSGQIVPLTKRASDKWLDTSNPDTPEVPVPFLLRAVNAATQSKAAGDVKFALTNLIPKLEGLTLNEEQKSRLVAMKEALEALSK